MLDPLGHHRVACPHSGHTLKRATPVERVMARICRETGARGNNAFMRDMNVSVPTSDVRRIEMLAQDMPCFGGAQLAVDVTLRSALTKNGEAQPSAAEEDGAILLQTRVDKENTQNSSTGDVGS